MRIYLALKMQIKFMVVFIQDFSALTQYLLQGFCQEICNFLSDWFNFKQSFKKKKRFSTFQAIAKVTEHLENTKRDSLCNWEKWIIKMVGAMNILK